MTATQTYAVLPTPALVEASALRDRGDTFPSILRELTLRGWNTADYDAQLLRRHVQRHVRATTPGPALVGPRRFGVEIECWLPPHRAVQALRDAGLVAEVETYNHRVRDHWKVTTDATVQGGCEVVAPPLTDWADVATAMSALRAAGGRVDRRTGFHVHHEVTDLAPAAVANLVDLYAAHHDELDGLVAPSRRRNQWCGRMPEVERQNTVARLRRVQGSTPTAIREDARRHGFTREDNRRYRSLNVYSYGSYGTVEFRQHQGTLSGAKAEAWVNLGRAMILAAAAGTAVRVGHLVEDLAAAGHLDAPTADFLARRAAVLAA